MIAKHKLERDVTVRERFGSVRRGSAPLLPTMPITMSGSPTGGTRFPSRPAQKPNYIVYSPPKKDPAAEAVAAKKNDLLNMRSKNIQHIMAQRTVVGFDSHTPIQLPPANPKMEALHKELGIDKVVTVKCPFVIDTTPGGQWANPLLTQDTTNGGSGKLRDSWMPGFREKGADGPARTDAVEFSANGNKASAVTPDGRLMRGGWSVS